MPELMDLPHSDGKALIRTLRQFRLINLLLSRSRSLLREFLVPDMLACARRSLTLLDLGAGHCDLGRWMAGYAEKKTKRRLEVICLDSDPRVVSHMQEVHRNNPRLRVLQERAERIEEIGPFDYVFANHFLHHLPDPELRPMLRRICRSTTRLFLINDLLRSRSSYLFYTLFARLFLPQSFAVEDGRRSIRKGFLPGELKELLEDLGCSWQIRVFTRFPGRMCIVGIPGNRLGRQSKPGQATIDSRADG
jgi:2-polyprenyl-3-methyl-5-hydroxy-6-metoxy-1,4-benzoquinol methylase